MRCAAAELTGEISAPAAPQANDAKCGFACHTTVEKRDYVFTEYGKR
jgi:hypothetical protein